MCQTAGFDVPTRHLNWDAAEDRESIIKEVFPAGSGYLILDEIHKYSRWRKVVKGLFGKRGDEPQLLVTGNARLDHYRHGGDPLQGPYHFYRLLPLTCAEIGCHSPATIKDLLIYGGFPEPFSLQSEIQSRRWGREYRSRIIRGDLSDLENGDPAQFIECKTSNKAASPSLRYLKIRFPSVPATQMILEPDLELMTKDGIRICAAHRLLNLSV